MPHIKAIRQYINAGLSAAPVKIADKYPSMLHSWKSYQDDAPNDNEVRQWQMSYRDSNIYGCCLFCGEISGNLEVIDIDNHLGNAEEIFNDFMSIDEVQNIISTHLLPIEKTQSGGYHIFYKCKDIDGNLKLAKQQGKTVIETRGKGGLIVVAPTKGYEIIQGDLTDIPTISVDEKKILFEYSKMFSDAEEVIVPERKEINHTDYDGVRPGDWYNENCLIEAKDLLRSNGWTQLTNGRKELWRRPGKSKGVSATFGFVAPNIFYPFSSNSAPFEERKCYSPFYIYALFEHNNDYSAASKAIMVKYDLKPARRIEPVKTKSEKVITETKEESKEEIKFIRTKSKETSTDDRDFWYFSGKDGTKFCIDYFLLKDFLEKYGFYRYEINKDKYIYLKITSNVAESVSFETIRDFILNHLVRLSEQDIYNKFCDSSKFNEKTLSIVGSVDIEWMKDSKEECYLFYQNGYTVTTDKGTELKDYSTMSGVIWKSQQLDRNYTEDKKYDFKDAYAYKFCKLVSANDQLRINAYMSALGYLSHSFKQESFCPAIIFCDENDTDEPWGGTGKGMSAKFVANIKNLVSLDGKSFDSNERFAMQRVQEDTNIILIEDLDKHFRFENLFSKLTDGLTISKLYLGEVYIPFKESPKWAITANYMLRGSNSSSFERRMFAIEIHRYFKTDHTPDDEFDKSFFHEWNESDWKGFDLFMHECVRLWLDRGLIKPKYVTVDKNKLKANTSTEFVDWATMNIMNNKVYNKANLMDQYKTELNNPYINKNLSQSLFTRWIKQYCEFKEYEVNTDFGNGSAYVLIGDVSESEKDYNDDGEEEAPF